MGGIIYYHFNEVNESKKIFLFVGPWVPVVDSFLDSPFLPAEPEVLQRQNATAARVPVMLGFTSEDGLLFTSRLVADPQFNARFISDKRMATHFDDDWPQVPR